MATCARAHTHTLTPRPRVPLTLLPPEKHNNLFVQIIYLFLSPFTRAHTHTHTPVVVATVRYRSLVPEAPLPDPC